MSEQVTLTIPEHIYRQAQKAAAESGRELPDVLSDMLRTAYPPVYVSEERPQMEREEAAFAAQRDALLAEYRDRFVAMKDGQVVDHDADRVALVQRLQQSFPNQIVLVKLVTDTPQHVFRAPSPRLIRS